MIVKNVSSGPQTVEGSGVLASEEVGPAEDTPHTRALLDAGHLIEMPDEAPQVAEVAEAPARTTRRGGDSDASA